MAIPASGQPSTAARGDGEPIRLAQLLDTSADQQDVSRDYSTGVRLAAVDFNRTARRRIQLIDFKVDGSAPSLSAALEQVRSDGSICGLMGTAGERLSLDAIQATKDKPFAIAHLAPWLSDSRFDTDLGVVPVFASREAQVRFALRSLESLAIVDIGIVYPSRQTFTVLRAGVEAAAKVLKLKPVSYLPEDAESVATLAGRLPVGSPVVLLFLGDTIELSLFAQALASRRLQRYVVSLADIDVGTLLQLGGGGAVPLILTQVVPNPRTSTLPVVRDYRASLAVQYDEKPSQLSLAGYVAGRYVFPVLARMERPMTRDNVLAEFERRPAQDVGGFPVGFTPQQRRGSSFVTQTFLTKDGRQVG